MDYLDSVQKGINYIEENLDFNLNPRDVAEKACISQWHFQRIFKALTNETLKTYIRSRRLANALDLLIKTDDKILDIAVTAGFKSQESFTRAFKKAFDMTPNQARKNGHNTLFLKKIEFDQEYLEHINNNVSLEPEIITQEKRIFVGIKTEFYGVDSEKNNFAEKLPAVWEAFLLRVEEISHRVPEYGAYGILQQTKDKADLLEYCAAREVSKVEDMPEGMCSIEIPKTTYARFTHKGDPYKINNTVNYIYSSWLMQSDWQHTYEADIEFYNEKMILGSEDSVNYYSIPITN